MTNSNPNNFKTTKEAMDFVKDFINTPFDELIEQGYGVIEDPVSAFKAELKEIKSKPWYPGQGSRIKELKELISPKPVTIDDVTFIDGDVPKVTIMNNTERLVRSINK